MASAGSSFASVAVLFENSPEIFLDVSEWLLKFANNILNNPSNPKYKRIRVANPIVEERLLPFSGAVECLFEMGFEEDGEFFTFPVTALLDNLASIRDELVKHRQRLLEHRPNPSDTGQAAPSGGVPGAVALATGNEAGATGSGTPSTWSMQVSEARFFQRLKTVCDHVLRYEDLALQHKARACIPFNKLQEKAKKNYEAQLSTTGPSGAAGLEDLLLLELLAWFKHSFFHWMDAPKCDGCGCKTQGAEMAEPTLQELHWGASRVENYFCGMCQRHTRFPRYNHPEKLLETRVGRCGEWANCFTLCCRALGFDARYVLDWTDHVWTEVHSKVQKRWLHCDPCENTCDKPLQYEAGWGKKLTYVLAFSKDDIQDVTWRYSVKHAEVLQRRLECRESWLINTILKLRRKQQAGVPKERKKELEQRLVAEIAEFMIEKTAGEGELTGRTSGSLAWRSARAELGGGAVKLENTVIRPTEAEKVACMVHLQYSCALDRYIRVKSGGHSVEGWQELASEIRDIHRKEEHDWGMVYLARAEGSDTASITWRFDFSESGLVVDKVEVEALSTCYEDGRVVWRLCGDEQCTTLPSGGTRTRTCDLAGSSTLAITADLFQGRGNVAWQHTQLFRQKMDSHNWPLDVKIWLKE